ncbi:MAG TPA: PTS system mannose/fructose/sorbose family transporter subunit IID, partial [Deltaproteobacteria bacterium]|jgi:PTS system mannose-specific IID component|nr:PTS system mannose/fructose/sorbose family transporter subunit IID [Deltaproteobacteria bacterium]
VRLSKGTIAKILWRSFFVQGSWNFKGMQNIGFAYAMIPGLKRLAADGPDRAVSRYVKFSNTHPYMAPTVMGVFLKLEEQGDLETIEKLKQTIASSLAAIGDTFFWATLKPIIALLFLLTVMADRIWGIALVLVAYNAVHLWTMIRGFSHGYQKGPGGALEIGKILSLDRTRRISYSIPLLAGMVIGALSQWENAGTGLPVSLVIFLASAAAFRFKIGTFWIFYGVFTLTLIWTIIR